MQETTEPASPQAAEARSQLALFPAPHQPGQLIAQWASTWTTFLQRDAYNERDERAASDPPACRQPAS